MPRPTTAPAAAAAGGDGELQKEYIYNLQQQVYFLELQLKYLRDAPGGGGVKAEQLRAQQEAHEREMEEQLARQAKRLQAEHDAEMEELRARMAAQHASELAAVRREASDAKEAARTAQASGNSAARDARMESEKTRATLESAHRAELTELKAKHGIEFIFFVAKCLFKIVSHCKERYLKQNDKNTNKKMNENSDNKTTVAL